jgi:hypothetical protein
LIFSTELEGFFNSLQYVVAFMATGVADYTACLCGMLCILLCHVNIFIFLKIFFVLSENWFFTSICLVTENTSSIW